MGATCVGISISKRSCIWEIDLAFLGLFWELECMTFDFYMAKVMHFRRFANSHRGWKGSQIHDLGRIYFKVM